jgi:hypothetical protein
MAHRFELQKVILLTKGSYLVKARKVYQTASHISPEPDLIRRVYSMVAHGLGMGQSLVNLKVTVCFILSTLMSLGSGVGAIWPGLEGRQLHC